MQSVPIIQVIAIILAGALCLGNFCARMWKILAEIRHARSEPGYRVDHLATRFATFIWEVAFQSKVIRERPVAGLAHAFVFWGFCAFALVTINHVAAGLGLRLLDYSRVPGVVYGGTSQISGKSTFSLARTSVTHVRRVPRRAPAGQVP